MKVVLLFFWFFFLFCDKQVGFCLLLKSLLWRFFCILCAFHLCYPSLIFSKGNCTATKITSSLSIQIHWALFIDSSLFSFSTLLSWENLLDNLEIVFIVSLRNMTFGQFFPMSVNCADHSLFFSTGLETDMSSLPALCCPLEQGLHIVLA